MTTKYWIDGLMYLVPEEVSDHQTALEKRIAELEADTAYTTCEECCMRETHKDKVNLERYAKVAKERAETIQSLEKRLEDAETLKKMRARLDELMNMDESNLCDEGHWREMKVLNAEILSRTDKQGGGA